MPALGAPFAFFAAAGPWGFAFGATPERGPAEVLAVFFTGLHWHQRCLLCLQACVTRAHHQHTKQQREPAGSSITCPQNRKSQQQPRLPGSLL